MHLPDAPGERRLEGIQVHRRPKYRPEERERYGFSGPSGGTMTALNKFPHFIILMVLAVYMIAALSADDTDVEVLDSEEFQKAVEDKAIVTNLPENDAGALRVRDGNQTVTGLLERDGGQPQEFEYSYPEHYDIAAVFNEADIPFTTDPQYVGFWTRALVGIAPIFLVVLFLLFMMRWMQGGGNRVMSFGKSRARRMTKDQPKVTFADVAGVEEAVQDLKEIREFLLRPRSFRKVGDRKSD